MAARTSPEGKRGRLQRGPVVDTHPLWRYLVAMEKKIRTPKRVPAVGYVRVSTSKQVEEGGSLEEQRDALAFYAAANGLDLVAVYEDAGISGAKDEDGRPGLAAAIEAIKAGKARVLLVRDLSRLARGLDLTGYLRVAVRKAGGVVKVMGESEDRIYRLFDAVKNEMYRTAVSDRMRLWATSRQAKGLPLGQAPYGFRIGPDGSLEEHPEETPTLLRIREARERGDPFRAIAAALNADGVKTRNGKAWAPATVFNATRRGLPDRKGVAGSPARP
ncbi:MAG: recombinase family protein [Thermoanaerobaculia bacterium]|nr:recombinase family protein [Thermoanaerobaculia bacterium]